jgi:hypothetical protein
VLKLELKDSRCCNNGNTLVAWQAWVLIHVPPSAPQPPLHILDSHQHWQWRPMRRPTSLRLLQVPHGPTLEIPYELHATTPRLQPVARRLPSCCIDLNVGRYLHTRCMYVCMYSTWLSCLSAGFVSCTCPQTWTTNSFRACTVPRPSYQRFGQPSRSLVESVPSHLVPDMNCLSTLSVSSQPQNQAVPHFPS